MTKEAARGAHLVLDRIRWSGTRFPLKRLLRLWDDDVAALVAAAPAELRRRGGLGDEKARRFAALAAAHDGAAELENLRRIGAAFVCPCDAAYARVAARIVDQPPAVLYHRGDFDLVHETSVALIGSRRPSHYGREMARHLAAGLAGAGTVTISGLARGIDGEAHRATLAAGGRTIAVLGTGVDRVYPPEHRRLMEDVAARGLLLSECPPGCPPLRGNFPRRNRIISGISWGVVVVEAALRSGTFITVERALEQGREVMAVPGNCTSSTSAGSNALIQQGAAVVTCVEDLLLALGLDRSAADGGGGAVRGRSDRARRVLDALGDEPETMGVLMARSGLGAGAVAEEILQLLNDGLVVAVEGNRYAKRLAPSLR